jgi:hypothetical protein
VQYPDLSDLDFDLLLLIAVWPDTPPGWYHQILNQVNSFLPEPHFVIFRPIRME